MLAPASAGTSAPSFFLDIRIRFSGLVHSSLFKARQAAWKDPSQKCATGIAVWCSTGKKRFGTVMNTSSATRMSSDRKSVV